MRQENFLEIFEHADELRCKGVYDITEIVNGFYRHELREYLEENGSKASLFLKRFVRLTQHFVDTDPRYQSRMDRFCEEVS